MISRHGWITSRTAGAAFAALALCTLAGCPLLSSLHASVDAAPQSGPTGTTVTFDGNLEADEPYYLIDLTEKLRGDDPEDKPVYIIGWAWDFDDGRTGTGKHTAHTFNAPGQYWVELSVTVSEAPPESDDYDEVIVRPARRTLITIEDANEPPVADAGPDQQVDFNTLVQLDGSGSTDPDEDPLTFAWAIVSAPAGSALTTADITAANTATPSVLPDVAGTYVFELTVGDGSLTDTDTVSVLVGQNGVPTADAGPDQTVHVGTQVVLDGSGSTDPDGDAITYAWQLTGLPEGSQAVLDDAAAAQPSFTADVPGVYTAQLTVSDAWDSSAPDTVVITAANQAPASNAGPDQTVHAGTQVALDGSGSADPDGDTITYAWQLMVLPQGSQAVLDDAAAAQPSFTADVPGVYTAQLVVSDAWDDGVPDTVVITATNQTPMPDAGPDQDVALGALVTLDGSGSTDGDDDPLTYAWQLVDVPAGSAAVLSDAGASSPTFTADAPGTYTAQLVVSDPWESSAPDTVVITTLNSVPIADAGPNERRLVGSTVTLDGSESYDPDGDALTFAWTFVSVPQGSVAALSDGATASPSFIIDIPGDYVAQLIVNDGEADSAPDTVTVSTENSPPVADAGPDQTLRVTQTAMLDGSGSSDADGDDLIYIWSFVSIPATSAATLSNADSVSPSFVIDVPGDYTVQLVVEDGKVDSEPDTVVIHTENTPPVADAGPDQSLRVTQTAVLDGSGSSDVDGDALTYAWSFVSRPEGEASDKSEAVLDDPAAVNPSFVIDLPGEYVLQLIVNDGTVDSEPDTVVVNTENSPPVADAGPDQTRLVTQTATLDGSGSSDVDGDPLTYAWSFVSVPEGDGVDKSAAVLDDPTAVHPSFVIDLPGDYVLQLVVNDGKVDSAPDTVVVSTENSPPVADAGPDQTRLVTQTATLNGSRSSDVDGDPLTYAWSFVSVPDGAGSDKSAAVLDDPTAVRPSFVVDLPGEYVLQLIVNDGKMDSAPDTAVVSTENSPPVADAGPDQTRLVTETVVLDGSGSDDVDGDPLSYAWSFVSRPQGDDVTKSSAVLDDPSAVNPSFVIDLPGDYVLQLIVNDGKVDSAPDTVVVSTTNSAPVADAGPDQTRLVTETVVLDGSGSNDVDGDPLSYAWSFVSRPHGDGVTKSSAVLDDPSAVNPSFVIDLPGDYVLQLIVNDGKVDSAPDTVVISTENSPPVANAGPDQTRFVTETVTLNGSGSSDVDGDPLTYAWSFVSKPASDTKSDAVLLNADTVSPSFVIDESGTYVVRLVVNDGTADSAPDTVVITTENSPPVANAGPNQTHFVTEVVTLDGTGSYDVDGDPLTYSWSFLSAPTGETDEKSAATLSDPASPTPIFVIDLPGIYVLQLVVNDGKVNSAPDTVMITTENSAPIADAGPDQSALVSDVVTLDGSGSSDVDGDLLAYAWSVVSAPAGVASPSSLLSDPSGVQPFFTLGVAGTYVFQLVVNDGTVDSDPDTVVVTTDNTPPVADAGADQTGRVFDTINLDGTGSYDVDLDPLTYAWNFVSKPQQSGSVKSSAQLVGADTATPSFVIDEAGTYVLQLIVSDGTVDSVPDTVQVTTENTPPVAVAGDDRSVPILEAAMLDGTGSYDVDNDPLTYLWSVLSVPFDLGDVAKRGGPYDFILDDVTSPTPSFFPEVPGPYVFQLIVNDGTVDSPPDSVVITATNQPPLILLVGQQEMTVECGTSYDESGAIVSDPEEGDITHRLNITGTVDTSTPGEYLLTYTASDSLGAAAAPVVRTVTVVDTTPPEIEIVEFGQEPMYAECGYEGYFLGAYAFDSCDSTVSATTLDAEGVDFYTPGTYTATYSATDSSGNTGTADLTVIVQDTAAPQITLLGANPIAVECGSPYVDPGAVATDGCEGDLENVIVDASQVDTGTPGTYTVYFSATDSASNTGTETRSVVVQDNTAPSLSFIGPAVQEIECGSPYTELGVVVNDACDPEPDVSIDVIGEDTSQVGSFLVRYTATDAAGNERVLTRTVNVVDTTPPEIHLYFEGTELTVNCGGEWEPPGGYVTDVCDLELPLEVDASGVNALARGVYELVYTAEDGAGNLAEVILPVFVEGICPPEIGTLCPEGGILQGPLLYEAGFETDLDGFILDNAFGSGNGLWHRSTGCYAPNIIDGSATILYFGQDTTCDYDLSQAVGGLATSPTLSLPGGPGSATLVFNYLLTTEGVAGTVRDYATVQIYNQDTAAYSIEADNSAGRSVILKAVIWPLCDDALSGSGSVFKGAVPGGVEWHTAIIDISTFRGSDINLVFSFDTGDEIDNSFPGFAIDNVAVYATEEVTP